MYTTGDVGADEDSSSFEAEPGIRELVKFLSSTEARTCRARDGCILVSARPLAPSWSAPASSQPKEMN